MWSRFETNKKDLAHIGNLALLKLSKVERKEKIRIDLDAKEAAKQDDGSESDVANAIEEEVKKAKAKVRSTARKVRPTRNVAQTPNVMMPPPAAPTTDASAMPPPTNVRRSTRKRTTKMPYGMETPLAGPSKRIATGVKATPMITPKFDPTTPLSRTVMRLAKPNETLVSLSGSPVYAGATTAKKGRGRNARTKAGGADDENLAVVPLGNGKLMMLPTAKDKVSEEKLELDEEEREKLLTLKSQLDNMLKM